MDVATIAEKQADSGGDGWIDTTVGRTHRGYDDDEEDAESSTYFSNQAPQGKKRKKAPFFKYSKKRKGYSNTSYNSKGCVGFVSYLITSHVAIHLFSCWKLFPFPTFALSCCGVVNSGAATATINPCPHPAPGVDQKLQAGGPGAQQEMDLQARDPASCPPPPLKPIIDPS